jgi:CMP/dCMP kinase
MLEPTPRRANLQTFVVTIDGPSASGKSSVAREIARRHGWAWVSTGAFYRGLALVAKVRGIGLDQSEPLAALAVDPSWSVRMELEQTVVILDGKDVTEQIYREDVGLDASRLSQIPQVRKSLLEAQRRCRRGVAGLVAEGRDCGTVVFPEAPVKIYLTARSDNRVKRRALEEGRSVEETRVKQSKRDHQDTTRQAAPLQIPPNATVVDTSDMDLQAVIGQVDTVVSTAFANFSAVAP